jgi:hypothetical protein
MTTKRIFIVEIESDEPVSAGQVESALETELDQLAFSGAATARRVEEAELSTRADYGYNDLDEP